MYRVEAFRLPADIEQAAPLLQHYTFELRDCARRTLFPTNTIALTLSQSSTTSPPPRRTSRAPAAPISPPSIALSSSLTPRTKRTPTTTPMPSPPPPTSSASTRCLATPSSS